MLTCFNTQDKCIHPTLFHPEEELLDHSRKSTVSNPNVVIQNNFKQAGVDDVNILNHTDLEYLT